MSKEIGSIIVPLIIFVIITYGFSTKIVIFDSFLTGAKEGLNTAFSILPTLIGILTAIYMLRASGAIDFLAFALSPVMEILGIPPEVSALVLLKPISGSGGLALGSELISTYGADSYIGNVTSVMLASSETSIYTIGIYLAHVNLNHIKGLLPAALSADIIAFISSAFFVRLFLM